jgi:hypothetical protein
MNTEFGAGLSRSDFLRVSALSGAGLGLAGLGAAPGAAAEAAPSDTRRGYVVAVTHGPSDATRVMLALFTATRLPAGENHVWFAIDGGQLCKKGDAEKVTSPLFVKQGNAGKLIDEVRSKGTKLHI